MFGRRSPEWGCYPYVSMDIGYLLMLCSLLTVGSKCWGNCRFCAQRYPRIALTPCSRDVRVRIGIDPGAKLGTEDSLRRGARRAPPTYVCMLDLCISYYINLGYALVDTPLELNITSSS
jgi:hypothetical protein